MANYNQAWLEDPTSIRGILVEVTVAIWDNTTSTWVDTILYLSNIGYVTGDSQTSYLPYLTGALQTTESMSIDGSLSMSFGDIQIANFNGELDEWLDSTKYIWMNRPIQIYLGDPRWRLETVADIRNTSVAGFQKIFDGVVSDIDSSDRDSLNIKVRDKLERLNGPVSENKLGTYGTWGQGQTNQDSIRPLVFGEVFNLSPLYVDPSKLEYMFHDTNVGSIITSTIAGTLTINPNVFNCTSTAGFIVGAKAVFTGTVFGGPVANTVYYIKQIFNSTQFTVAQDVGLNNLLILVNGAPATGTSMQVEVATSSTEQVIEIRDNGFPIYTDPSVFTSTTLVRPTNATIELDAGKFKLTKPPAGVVTISLQGAKRSINLDTGNLEGTYVNNIANIIALIATQYGPANTRLSAADLDLVNLKAFSLNNTQSIGVAITDRTNILNVCNEIAGSANARIFMNRVGKLQLLQIGTPVNESVAPKVYITDNDIIHHSLKVSTKTEVVASTKIGYCKNYTRQTSLAAQLPATHNAIFRDEWLSTTVVDPMVQINYRLDSLPVQQDTYLIRGVDSSALAQKINNYWKVPRIIYSFTGTSKLLSLVLGQAVNLTHNRFGLASGKDGQVLSLSPDWINGTITIEVII